MVEIVTQSRVDAARKHWRDLDRRMAAVGWQINQAAFSSDGPLVNSLFRERCNLLDQRQRAFAECRRLEAVAATYRAPRQPTVNATIRQSPLFDTSRGVMTRDMGRARRTITK